MLALKQWAEKQPLSAGGGGRTTALAHSSPLGYGPAIIIEMIAELLQMCPVANFNLFCVVQ